MIFIGTVIIYDPSANAFLLQHRDPDAEISPGKWGLFGGHGENGEQPIETALRELKEESGIELTEQDLSLLHDYEGQPGIHRFVFVTEKINDKNQVKLMEGQGYAWVPAEKVFDYDLTDRTRFDIQTFLKIKPK